MSLVVGVCATGLRHDAAGVRMALVESSAYADAEAPSIDLGTWPSNRKVSHGHGYRTRQNSRTRSSPAGTPMTYMHEEGKKEQDAEAVLMRPSLCGAAVSLWCGLLLVRPSLVRPFLVRPSLWWLFWCGLLFGVAFSLVRPALRCTLLFGAPFSFWCALLFLVRPSREGPRKETQSLH
jgi:hypothetical protein